MISPAKINLSLQVGRQRPDGFHEIDSVFALLKFGDTMELERGGPAGLEAEGYEVFKADELTLAMAFDAAYPASCRKDILAGLKNNSVLQAWRLLRRECPSKKTQPLRLRLTKMIPTGAGLGGGSSNAACALKIFIRSLGLRVRVPRLMKWAAELGSDVPFFLKAKGGHALWHSTGRGERLKELRRPCKSFVLILYPGFAVPTRWAYGALDKLHERALTAHTILPRLKLKSFPLHLGNSFEPVVFKAHPVLAEAKRFLSVRGAERISLTGSGSCLFALTQRRETCRQWVDAMRMSKRFAGFHYYATEIDN